MKVTAIISDKLIEEIKKLTKGKNITESITIALEEWLAIKRIKELNQIVREQPLEFRTYFTAGDIRETNRK
jgi:hypothetical protein